ncbi:hypothetical protein PHISCL_00150 [Aspergillus sclerotialis]|uniref:Reverse transcriptase domain-containing protein n=1 Tax=Aspergillus sclerotialis TaxID=2070753 RepID=A0A3A3A772_9EURO|nr:hypothetical protein PHISCL_00150 [Aspergillus sclerotialis]
MDPGDEELTTFRTGYGNYKYKGLPPGLSNGPATFHRFVTPIFLLLLDEFLAGFTDDLLIHGDNDGSTGYPCEAGPAATTRGWFAGGYT